MFERTKTFLYGVAVLLAALLIPIGIALAALKRRIKRFIGMEA